MQSFIIELPLFFKARLSTLTLGFSLLKVNHYEC